MPTRLPMKRRLDFNMSLKGIWGLLKTAASCWMKDNAPRLGASVSYYTIFALSPLFIICIFIASLWFNKAFVQTQLFDQVGSLLGKRAAQGLQSALSSAVPHAQGWLASIIAIATLILSSTGLFMELQAALNAIWGVEQKPSQGIWGFVRVRLLSFAMIVAIGFLLLVSLIVSAALAAVGKYIAALVPGLDILWMIVNVSVSFLVITVLFAMIFKVLPDVKISWSDVWVGSATTALLFTAGKTLLGLYLGRSSTVSAYGAAGSLVLVLLWVYYSAQILFFGAELTQAYANRYGARLEPKPYAQWVQPGQSRLAPKAKPELAAPEHDRKQELVSELRKEVEQMRAIPRSRRRISSERHA